MSEDDLSYYHSYGEGTQGYATKMVLDENGEVKCEYTDENGETHVGDYDMVPRLDTFVKKHPDFSYHGHKATVALTGYDGVFGYRTNDYYKDINNPHLDKDQRDWLSSHPDFNWDQDVAEAKKIAETMKANGWTFASHTYAHWNASNKTAEQLKADNERWMTCVSNIVGKTDKIIFAFGGDIGGAGGYTADNPKYQYFKDQGFPLEKIWFFNEGAGESTMYHGHHIDLWRANAWLLEQCGIIPSNIQMTGIDTYSDLSFYSARREGVQCGRIISSIKLL